jgi:hypothetical protein
MLRENSLVVGITTSLLLEVPEELKTSSYETKEVGFQVKRLRRSYNCLLRVSTVQTNAETTGMSDWVTRVLQATGTTYASV